MKTDLARDDAFEALPSISQRLLVVDDDTVHRMVICRMARQAGYQAEEAACYEAVLRLMGEQIFACVTLDLSLGDHGGLDVLQHMAQIGFQSPVIVISGADDAVREETFAAGRKLGLNLCRPFAKPLKLGELRDLLREIHKRQAVGLTPRGA